MISAGAKWRGVDECSLGQGQEVKRLLSVWEAMCNQVINLGAEPEMLEPTAER